MQDMDPPMGPLGQAENCREQKSSLQNLSSALGTQGRFTADPAIRKPNLTTVAMCSLGAVLPFLLLQPSLSQKVQDIWPKWPPVMAHQSCKLPPREEKGNL